MEQPRSEGNFWPFFAGATVIVIVLAAILWSNAHPYGIHWDEAEYLDQVGIDVQRLQAGKLLTLGGRILIKSLGRPPAYRILVLPFLAVFGFHPLTARLVSLTCFGLTCWFVYLATCQIASRVAGAFAVLIFALSPEVIAASIVFGTDTSLYLATSAMLYYLFVCWTDRSEHPGNWIGLGLSVGLGFLSKASFVLIALPVLGFWLVVDRWSHLGVPSLVSQRKAGLLALLVGAPWWVLNLRSAISTAEEARGFVRDSLGPPSFTTGVSWLNTVCQGLLGHGLSVLIGLIVITYCGKVLVRKETILDPLQKLALGACICAGLPIVLAQLSGTNHLLRHISPAVIPLAITVGVLSDKTGWARSGATVAVSSIIFCVQLGMIVAPVLFPNSRTVDLGLVNSALPWRVMARSDQWDWRPLQDLVHSCGLETPKISYLGNGRGFTGPQIVYFWVAQGKYADVRWLWRYEEGPLDWGKLMESVGQSDIAVTAPHYIGAVKNKQDLDNQYNAEFAERLSRDQRFQGPIRLEMGRFEPVEVAVYLKKTLVCHWGEATAASQ